MHVKCLESCFVLSMPSINVTYLLCNPAAKKLCVRKATAYSVCRQTIIQCNEYYDKKSEQSARGSTEMIVDEKLW